MKRVHLVALALFAILVVSPMLAYADAPVSVTRLEDVGAQAVFNFTTGCITTNVVAGINKQEIRHIPGSTREKPTFAVAAVNQFSSSRKTARL